MTGRIGLRNVSARGRDILLNGRGLELLGVNRYEALFRIDMGT